VPKTRFVIYSKEDFTPKLHFYCKLIPLWPIGWLSFSKIVVIASAAKGYFYYRVNYRSPFQGSKSNVVFLNPQIPFGAVTIRAYSACSEDKIIITNMLKLFVEKTKIAEGTICNGF
jgi:hypothetical protein